MNIVALIVIVFLFSDIPNSIQHRNVSEHVCGRPLGTEFRLEEDRIVAGYDIGYYRYPWYAALIRNGQVSCGGALIGPRTVVTAAHCFKEFLNMNKKGYLKLEPIYKVKLGVYNICEAEKTQREYGIEKVQIHEEYSKKKPYYDICLLTLADDTSDYEPICLPESELPNKPKDGTVPGLGTIKYQGITPCTVHEARLLIYNESICHEMIANTGNDANDITNAFCAGYIQGGIDTCQGDSGGPLQSMNANGDYTLLGIVSFGFQCAKPGLLGMYTDVSEYLDWIQEKSGLDAGIVDIIYNKTTAKAIAATTPPRNKRGHRRRYYFGKPFKRPIRVIVLKHQRFHPMMKMVLHHPMIRSD